MVLSEQSFRERGVNWCEGVVMDERRLLEIGKSVLEEDPACRRMLHRGLAAYANILGAVHVVHQPERFLETDFQWGRWEEDLRDSLAQFGQVFFEACMREVAFEIQGRGVVEPPATSPPVIPPQMSAPAEPPLHHEDEVESTGGLVDELGLEPLPPLAAESLGHVDAPTADQEPEVTHEMLSKLQRSFNSSSWSHRSSPRRRVDRRTVMDDMRSRGQILSDCFEANDHGRRELLVAGLMEASAPQFLEMCAHTSADLQRIFVEMVAALGRVFQERYKEAGDEVQEVFARLMRFLDDGHLADVYGLSRTQRPRWGTWLVDARRLWRRLRLMIENDGAAVLNLGTSQRLVEQLIDECEDDFIRQEELKDLVSMGLEPDARVLRLLAPVYESLEAEELRPLRRKIREQMHLDDQEAQMQDYQGGVSDQWPFFAFTRGRPAILIGSMGKKHQIESIREAFGFLSLEWVDACRGLGRIEALCRGVDDNDPRMFIVMQRYTSHQATELIWAQRERAAIVDVEDGLGIDAVRRAIERYGHGQHVQEVG